MPTVNGTLKLDDATKLSGVAYYRAFSQRRIDGNPTNASDCLDGTNTLCIDVANLPLNRFLGAPDEDLAPLRAVYGNRFPAPEEKSVVHEPVASGLLGPVTLRFAR